jgi:DNA-binding transcriptional LysR family regulator
MGASRQARGLLRGRLRVAAVTTAAYFVPELIGPFVHAHPGLAVALVVENRDAVVCRLTEGEHGLAVMMLPPATLPLERWPFLENPLVVVVPAAAFVAHLRQVLPPPA